MTTGNAAMRPVRKVPDMTPHVTIAVCIDSVIVAHGVSRPALLSPNRRKNLVRARQVAMWLAYRLTDKSYMMIGRALGGRDHTTILHGVRRVDELRAVDSAFCEMTNRLLNSLKPENMETV